MDGVVTLKTSFEGQEDWGGEMKVPALRTVKTLKSSEHKKQEPSVAPALLVRWFRYLLGNDSSSFTVNEEGSMGHGNKIQNKRER